MRQRTNTLLLSVAAFISGTLITLSLAPFNLWPLAIIALMALHSLLCAGSVRQSLYTGAAFGIGLLLSGAYWVYVSMHDHGGASPLLAGIMTLGFCSGIGLLVAPFTGFYRRFIHQQQPSPHAALLNSSGFAALWLLAEWFRSWFLTGFPWLFTGYSQLNAPLSGWAPVVGTLGIGFMLAFSAAVISQSLQQRRSLALLLMPMALFASGWLLQTINWTEAKNERAYRVALVQANIAQEDKWNPAFKQPIMRHYQQVTEQQDAIDLVVWPETAIPEYLHRAGHYLQHLDDSLQRKNTALILGLPSAQRAADGGVIIYNTLVTAGSASGIYHKQKLVPFGEYVPLENLLRGLIEFFNLPMSAFSPGPANQPPLSAQDLHIQPYICYEIVYPDFVTASATQADVLLTVSNDSWFGSSIGPLQHLQMAQMRALEAGRYLIRATNNGVTAVIDNKGRITDRLPQFTEGVLNSRVYAYQGLTPVMQYGTLPAVIFSVLVLAIIRLRTRFSNR